jgi:hypothetical protein
LFTASFAIEKDNFIDLDIVGVEIEQEAIPAYNDFFSWSGCLENVFSDTSGDVFDQEQSVFVYIFLAEIFKYFFRFFFFGGEDKNILNGLIGGLDVTGYLVYFSEVSGRNFGKRIGWDLEIIWGYGD